MKYEPAWDLQLDACPPDQHFIEWVNLQPARGLSILHVGTGGHHLIGKTLTPAHCVMGVTLSPEEYESYIQFAADLPRYRLLFGNIHTLPKQLLPKFDYITLFHLGEILPAGLPDENMQSRRETIVKALLLTADDYLLKEHESARAVLYKDSAAAEWVVPIANATLHRDEEYKSLIFYRAFINFKDN